MRFSRTTLLLLAALVLLSAASVWIYLSRSGRIGSEREDRDFSYKDTASITSVFMADKDGNAAHIKRGPGGWVVNEKYPCRSEGILNLFEAIKNVEVKAPVQKEARENVLKHMAAHAVKVEIYKGSKLVKQYYVGSETPDGEGSYMLLTDISGGRNYNDPYVCFIPGFTGYLMPRYIVNENDWRDRVVLNYIPPQMKSVELRYPGTAPDSSFTLQLLTTTSFRLLDGNGRELTFDTEKVRQYLMYLQNVSYEGLITGRNTRLQDSLLTAGPFCIMTVLTTDNRKQVYNYYRKPLTSPIGAETGTHFEFDPNRLYMTFENGREWAIIQYFVFGKLLVNTSYFRPADSVKK